MATCTTDRLTMVLIFIPPCHSVLFVGREFDITFLVPVQYWSLACVMFLVLDELK